MTPPRRRIAKSTISHQRVLDAAARLFRERGYTGTTLRAIAAEVHLEAGSIYYHFKSKDDLIEAVLYRAMDEVIRNVREAVDAVPAAAPARARIAAAVRAHVSTIVTIGDYTLATRRVFGQVPEPMRARLMRQRDSYGRFWQDLLEAAQAEGALRLGADMHLARLFILGGLNWTVEWFKPERQPLSEVVEEFTRFVVDGLAAPCVE